MTRLAKRLLAFFAAIRRVLRSTDPEAEWVWIERRAALEHLFGPASGRPLHAFIPLHLPGGQADVLTFENHIVGGRLYVTAGLTGPTSTQLPNGRWTQYELAICQREDAGWAPNVIAQLASRSLRDSLRPGETMDLRSAGESAIAALLFAEYGSFRLAGRTCGVLLCLGITAEEMTECLESGSTVVFERLRGSGVYPFTDVDRDSFSGGAA